MSYNLLVHISHYIENKNQHTTSIINFNPILSRNHWDLRPINHIEQGIGHFLDDSTKFKKVLKDSKRR